MLTSEVCLHLQCHCMAYKFIEKKQIVSRTVWAIITSFVILYYLSISISRILMVDDQL